MRSYGGHRRRCQQRLLQFLQFIRLRLRKRALLIFLTALDDPMLAANFTRAIDLVRRQHLVFVNMFTFLLNCMGNRE